jgi:hypothetical protein
VNLTFVMAWTQADADAVRAAIVDLATGKRVVVVSYAGPPQRSVEYGTVDLPALRELLAVIERSVSGTTTFRRVKFSKGFDPPKDY